MSFLAEIWHYDFLRTAFVTSVVVGIACGTIGCFIVLRGLALMGDAISHAVLPGVAVSFMLGISFFYGAVAAGVLTALGIGYVNQRSRIKSDSSIGIVFTAFLALGIILIAEAGSSLDLTTILFGNVLSVRRQDMWLTLAVGAVGAVVVAVIIAFFKEFLVSTFDPVMAAAYGLPVRGLHYALMLLLTLVTVASMQTVGVVLVVAMLITPASTAYLLTNRLRTMVVLSAAFGVLAAVVGLWLSFTYNLQSGAVMVLASFAVFVLVFLLAPRQGVLVRALHKHRQRAATTRKKVSLP